MNPDNERSREYPPCGYGLLGLCCSDCLRGPCRISPFEKAQTLCGAGAGLLVAGNLCRLTAKELAPILKSLMTVAGQFRKRKDGQAFSESLTGHLARKYGISMEGVLPFLRENAAGLLEAAEHAPPSVLSSLLPERILGSLPGSPLLTLSGLLEWEKEKPLENLLWACLGSAAAGLVAEELTLDMLALLQGAETGADSKASPVGPGQPLVLSVSEGDAASHEIKNLGRALREDPGIQFLSLGPREELFGFCRRLSRERHRPIFDLPLAVLVESPNTLSILGPLSLGLPVVSDPPLPIQGGKEVEEFFCAGLKTTLGNFYLSARDETVLSRLKEALEKNL